MIHIPSLRTRRLTVQLRELTIGDALALAAMPPHQEEAASASPFGTRAARSRRWSSSRSASR